METDWAAKSAAPKAVVMDFYSVEMKVIVMVEWTIEWWVVQSAACWDAKTAFSTVELSAEK
jgi:hypothetical protein